MSDSLHPEPEEHADNLVRLKDEGTYLGSLEGAARMRARILAILSGGEIVTVDADGVAVMTPGYAEECFGRLLGEVGEEAFRKGIVVRNAAEPCRLLLEAVLQTHAPGSGRSASAAPRPKEVADGEPAADETSAETESDGEGADEVETDEMSLGGDDEEE